VCVCVCVCARVCVCVCFQPSCQSLTFVTIYGDRTVFTMDTSVSFAASTSARVSTVKPATLRAQGRSSGPPSIDALRFRESVKERSAGPCEK